MISGALLIEDIGAVLTVVPSTLGAAVVILLAAVSLGLLLAVVRINNIPVAKQLVRIFIDYTRGIPLVIHLYIAYFILPVVFEGISKTFLGGAAVTVQPMTVLIVAYSLYTAVGQAENIRGAYASVEAGQWDAAYASGLSSVQALRRIILPQGLAVAVPVIFTSYLGVVKGMSIAFTIGVTDILSRARLASAQNYGYLEAYIAAALVYWALCALLSLFFNRAEKVLTKW